MVRKIVGITLLVGALGLTAFIFLRGGPIVPHIVGPITLAVVGVLALRHERRASRI